MTTRTAREYRKARREFNRFLKTNRKTKLHSGRVATHQFWRKVVAKHRRQLHAGIV